jgi:hypothetical protein
MSFTTLCMKRTASGVMVAIGTNSKLSTLETRQRELAHLYESAAIGSMS